MRTLTFGLILTLLATFAPPATAQDDDETSRVEKRVKRYVKRLEKREGTSFWNTVLQIENLGDDAVDHLVAILENGDDLSEKVKLGVAKALAGLDEMETSLDTMVALVKDGKDLTLRIAAADMIGSYGDEEMEESLAELMNDSYKPELRIAVAKALYLAAGSTKGTMTLKALLKSDDVRVRYAAALALAEVEDVESARLVLTDLEREPTERGRLARAYLRLDKAIVKAGKLMGIGKPIKAQPTPTKSALLEELIEMVEKYYVDGGEKIERERLISLAAKGIASGLDKHSSYWTPEEYQRFVREMAGEYAGIGVYVGYRGGLFRVISPIYSGPAYKAGIRSGDIVQELDGWSTRNQSMDDIVTHLKGKPGTILKIKIYRAGWEKSRVISVKRQQIALPTVLSETLPGGIGYIKVVHFGDETVKEFKAALKALGGAELKGMVLDLRDNGGGWMRAAVAIADQFLGAGKLIVYSEGRSKVLASRRDKKAKAETAYPDRPLVVLVDGGSASASEIVAGALQVHKRATVVGLKTYGKGTVQQPMQPKAKKEARLKLTVARYYLPNDKSIDGAGILPDVKIGPERRAGWKIEEKARLIDRRALREYVESNWPKHKATLIKLAYDDGRDPSAYPGFDAWYDSLETKADKQDVRQWVRELIRHKAADQRGAEFACDLLEDRILQRGVLALCEKMKLDPATVKEFEPFRKAFEKK